MPFSLCNRLILAGLAAFLFAGFAPVSLSAQEPAVLFITANTAYENGDYATAESNYRQIAEQYRNVSPDVFYNLGNSLFRLGRPGEAMLWYQRVLVLQPDHPEVQQNLKFLRSQIAFLEFEATGLDSWWLRFTANQLGGMGFAALWIALICLVTMVVIRSWRTWRPVFLLAAVCFLVIAGFFLWGFRARMTRLAVENRAIVTAPDVSALTSPLADAKPVIELPPGSELRMVEDRGPWVRVEIPGNIRGWLRAESLQRIWPLPPPSSQSSAS